MAINVVNPEHLPASDAKLLLELFQSSAEKVWHTGVTYIHQNGTEFIFSNKVIQQTSQNQGSGVYYEFVNPSRPGVSAIYEVFVNNDGVVRFEFTRSRGDFSLVDLDERASPDDDKVLPVEGGLEIRSPSCCDSLLRGYFGFFSHFFPVNTNVSRSSSLDSLPSQDGSERGDRVSLITHRGSSN